MPRFMVALLLLLFAVPAVAADQPKTEDEKLFYTLGLMIARQLSAFSIAPAELAKVQQGIADGASGRTADFDAEPYQKKVQQLAIERRKAKGEKLAEANKGFLEKAAKEQGVVKSDSGMLYLSVKEGSGGSPTAADTVKVNYRALFPDGREFDSSYKRNAPVELKMSGVIKCWNEALQKMKAGGKARLVCPPQTAYGAAGYGDQILPESTLVYEVELLEVKKLEGKGL